MIITRDFEGSDCFFLQTDTEDLIKDIVAQTSGFMPRDICALVADAGANLILKGNALIDTGKSEESDASLTHNVKSDSKSSEVASPTLGKESLTKALERSKKRNASALGTPKVIERQAYFGGMIYCPFLY